MASSKATVLAFALAMAAFAIAAGLVLRQGEIHHDLMVLLASRNQASIEMASLRTEIAAFRAERIATQAPPAAPLLEKPPAPQRTSRPSHQPIRSRPTQRLSIECSDPNDPICGAVER